MKPIVRNSLALAVAFLLGIGAGELLPRPGAQQPPATTPLQITVNESALSSDPSSVRMPLVLGMDDTKEHLLITLTTKPPVALSYDVEHTEKLIEQLGLLRFNLTPPRSPKASPGDAWHVFDNSEWYAGPNTQDPEKILVGLMDPRFGWVATSLDRTHAAALVVLLRQVIGSAL